MQRGSYDELYSAHCSDYITMIPSKKDKSRGWAFRLVRAQLKTLHIRCKVISTSSITLRTARILSLTRRKCSAFSPIRDARKILRTARILLALICHRLLQNQRRRLYLCWILSCLMKKRLRLRQFRHQHQAERQLHRHLLHPAACTFLQPSCKKPA